MRVGTESVTHRATMPYAIFLVLWLASVMALFAADASMAALAAATAAYAAVIGGATLWLLPPPAPAAGDDVLRFQPGSRRNLVLRLAIVGLTATYIFFQGMAGGALRPHGIYVPLLTPVVLAAVRVHTPLRGGLSPVLNFVMYALVPGTLLLTSGTSGRELGLVRSRPGSGRPLMIALTLPVIMCATALLRGGITVTGLLWIVVHNLLSNGFSEEFQSRSMNLAALRALAANGWALVVQAMIFALLHAGDTIPDYPGHPLLVIANVVALNAPMGLALGHMALRSRSLVMPAVVHVSLDTMARLVGAP